MRESSAASCRLIGIWEGSTDSTEEFSFSDEITHRRAEKWEIEADSSPELAAGCW